MNPKQQAMLNLFEQHVNAELDGDLETTMSTMTDNPHLYNIPNGMGGNGKAGVRAFYHDHLVGKFFPPDIEMLPVSRTVDENQIVDELVLKFTHTQMIEWMLPGVEPTGKPVEMCIVVIVKVEDGKIAHEHIYWDQASVLNQIGLLEPGNLPINNAAAAREILKHRSI